MVQHHSLIKSFIHAANIYQSSQWACYLGQEQHEVADEVDGGDPEGVGRDNTERLLSSLAETTPEDGCQSEHVWNIILIHLHLFIFLYRVNSDQTGVSLHITYVLTHISTLEFVDRCKKPLACNSSNFRNAQQPLVMHMTIKNIKLL